MAKSPQVLLIDDSDMDNYVNKSLLEKLEFASDIKVFKNGLEGISYLKKIIAQGKSPDLIFLDLNMPIMTGFEFLRQFSVLKKLDSKKTTIIVLTSSENPSDHLTARTLGADACLEKPLTKEKIREVYSAISTID